MTTRVKKPARTASPTKLEKTAALPPTEARLIVAGIGASAGGIEALQQFFQAMPPDTNVAFVVVVHLSPEHQSHLAEILANCTSMPVEQVQGNVKLKTNHIYVIPPNQQLEITDTSVGALPFNEPRGHRSPIDTLFRSLAVQHGDGFAVILSGGGADGAVGVKAVKEAGGLILVQDPRDAAHGSMPRAAIASCTADIVLPARELATRLAELAQSKESLAALEKLQQTDKILLARILGHLHNRSGHDFSKYKQTTVLRRLARRMQVHRIRSLNDYFAFLQNSAEEAQALFDDLLISVTAFFRDPEAFELLRERVIPKLFDDRPPGNSIRVWVPGCASGEEAYSLAILLIEEAEHRTEPVQIQVFATDLDENALAIARAGRYPAAIEGDISAERLRRFFIREGNYYRVRKELRDCILFAAHSLLRDPPFSRIDLASCRNLLIYLERELQEHAFAVLRYAIRNGGYLFLGAAENADGPYFRTVDKKHRIYTAREAPRRVPEVADIHRDRKHLRPPPSPPRNNDAIETPQAEAAHRILLEELAPPSILVNERRSALHLSETAGHFLQPRSGPLSQDVTDLVRKELQAELRTALFRAFDKGESSLSPFIPVRFNGASRRVALSVKQRPGKEDEEKLALVVFIDGGEVKVEEPQRQPGENATDAAAVLQLREELHQLQERLRQARSEQESGYEEYRSANEELQSINEEYRSTAEELETSKEELQSINEELETVNNELKSKLEEISRAHNDLENLMAATDIGTLFLDTDLCICRFTPPLSSLFSVTPADLGRNIGDFTTVLDYSTLKEDAVQVLLYLVPIERQTRSLRDNRVYLVRLRPYRTLQNMIDGVVITFVDVTAQKKTEDALRASQDQLARELAAIQRLHEMTILVVTSHAIPDALNQILGAAIDMQHTALGTIHLHNPETGALNTLAQCGFKQEMLDQFAVADDNSAYRQALQSGKRAIQKEITAPPQRELAEKAGYRSMQSTPLLNQKGAILGVLSTYFSGPYPLSEHDERLLDLLTRHAANLLERLLAEQSLKKANTELVQSTHELAQNELQLKQQAAQLRENDRRKTDFLAMLGHELRNPLAAIRNSISLLMTVQADDISRDRYHSTANQALAVLERQGRLMTRLVNDLLDIARINENKIELVRSPVKLADSIDSAVAALNAEMDVRRIKFKATLPSEPLYLDVDNERFLQILDNLLGNAVKFTSPGGRIDLIATHEDHNVVIRIKDNGIGISADFISTIFDQFTYSRTSPNQTGLGLGLSLVKRLVNMHGGTITAHSDGPGLGSEFILRLPLSKSASVTLPSKEAGPRIAGTFRMLVVDDSHDVADGLALLLRTQNHEVEIAYDSETAVDISSRLRPRIAFLDLSMPDIDGYELARRLRRKFPPAALVLVAISGHIEDERARAAGFDHYLLKPVSISMINKILAALV